MQITIDFDTRTALFSQVLVEDYKTMRREMIEFESEGYSWNEDYLSLVKHTEAMRVMLKYYMNQYNLPSIEASL